LFSRAVTESTLSCFHCGLPVPAAGPWRTNLLGEPRDFCCAGCRAVAEAITRGGLEDYYRLRTAEAPTASRADESDDRLLDREDLQESFVRRAGPLREAWFVLDRVRCPACLWLIERHLRSRPGVTEATVAYASQTARVVWDPSLVRLSAIRTAVREIGYEARPFDPSHRAGLAPEAARRDAGRLVFAGVLGMMVMNLALAAYVLGGPDAAGRLPLWETFGRWSALIASTVLLAYPGQDFFAGAWREIRTRRAGMDTPLVLGLLVAWAGSARATLRGDGAVYYDAIGMLVFFVLLARAFETRARLRAAAVLDRFAVIRPATAHRLGADGCETEIAALELCAGDVVAVRAGEIVPADGVVLEGRSSFDEAVVTGEPSPRPRGVGDMLVAGSCNREQPILLRVTRAGEASTLGEIRRLLESGLASRPRFVELADRLAGRLVVAVLLLAGATAIFWAARDPSLVLPATVAVLIVTCPCALALATPIALSIAAGRFAEEGVLPARMAGLERLARADSVAFDKTGTLTTSEPDLVDVATFGDLDRSTALAIAAALEAGSPHPVARTLRAEAGGSASECEHPGLGGSASEREHPGGGSPARADFSAHHAGRGIEGTIDGARWWIGAPEFAMNAEGRPAGLDARLASASAEGRLIAVLADRTGRAALFSLAERLRPGAREVVDELRRAGIGHTALLSGDAQGPVERLASSLGFDEAHGKMTAHDKLAWIRSREDAGARLLFVGDGLNDAPTLGAAGVSVSFAEAPQLSRLASDFVILGDDLGALVAARRIARRSRRLLVQNVAWAIGYNVLAVPLAALGLVPPWAAALGMSASSLIVVANAMRLRRRKAGESPETPPYAREGGTAVLDGGARSDPRFGRGPRDRA
jgi:Cu2+-exporting ATPase